MDNEKILQEMTQTAVKSVTTVSTLGYSVLQPEYFNKFVEDAIRQKTILNDARLMTMSAEKMNIDRIGFSGRVMAPATENTAASHVNPTTAQNQLVATEYIAMAGITDNALRRNIEKGNFANTLISMLSDNFGKDMESLFVFGDTTKYDSGDLLKSKNGWLAKADSGTKLAGAGTAKDFDPSTEDITDVMTKMLKKYPNEYLTNRSSLRFYLDSDKFDEYIDLVGDRETTGFDDVIAGYVAKPYKGVPVVEAPVLNDAEGTDSTDGFGQVAMLVDPTNLVYGIFDQVTLEPEREAKLRRTDYILTTEIDCHFENEKVGAYALFDLEKNS